MYGQMIFNEELGKFSGVADFSTNNFEMDICI